MPCGPIYKTNEVLADPQVPRLGLAAPAKHYKLDDIGVVRNGINFSKMPFAVRNAAPAKCAESVDILKEYGDHETEIAKLKAEGVSAET